MIFIKQFAQGSVFKLLDGRYRVFTTHGEVATFKRFSFAVNFALWN